MGYHKKGGEKGMSGGCIVASTGLSLYLKLLEEAVLQNAPTPK